MSILYSMHIDTETHEKPMCTRNSETTFTYIVFIDFYAFQSMTILFVMWAPEKNKGIIFSEYSPLQH